MLAALIDDNKKIDRDESETQWTLIQHHKEINGKNLFPAEPQNLDVSVIND